MSLIKRITILAALAAMTAGMSGCKIGPHLLKALTACAYGTVGACEDPYYDEDEEPGWGGPPPGEATPPPGGVTDPAGEGTPGPADPTAPPGDPTPPPGEGMPPRGDRAAPPNEVPLHIARGSSAGAAGARGERFRARFAGKLRGRLVTFKRPGGAGASNVVVGGRFRVSFLGNSRLGRQFSSGRWTSRGDLNYKIRSGKLTGDAYILLRFRRPGAGSLCLSVRGQARVMKDRKVQARGSFVALGGTREGARIVGSGSFSQLSGRSSAPLRGRGRLRAGTRRPLPALCAALAQPQ